MEEDMSTTWTKTIALVAMLCMLLSTSDVYAGPGSGAKPKKMGFFAKVGKAIKKAAHKAQVAVKKAANKAATAVKTAVKKTGMAIKTAGAKIVNAGMDTGVWAKQKLTGKKNKVWVCGHYDKNGKWIKGHWRKLNSSKPSGGNTANQGNYSDQGSYGDSGSDQSSESPSNGDEGLSGDGNSYEESAETPVAGDDPVLPEIPAEENTESEQSEQATQESGEAEQGKEFSYDTEVSMRTMGMLMDDIVKQSKSINTFKQTAKSNINYSVEVQSDINTTYEAREDDAGLLSRIVVWDIRTHNGDAGKYYSFFLSKMRTLDPKDRALVKDVVDEVRAGIVHEANNASSDEEKAVFNKRLSELKGY
jgi:hypothetical protein